MVCDKVVCERWCVTKMMGERWCVTKMARDKAVCKSCVGKMVCDKVVCEKCVRVCERWCVTKLCVKFVYGKMVGLQRLRSLQWSHP